MAEISYNYGSVISIWEVFNILSSYFRQIIYKKKKK